VGVLESGSTSLRRLRCGLMVASATSYCGVGRCLVLAAKHTGSQDLLSECGHLLARALLGLPELALMPRDLALVPIRSSGATRAQAGADPAWLIAKRAEVVLAEQGVDACVVELLRVRGRHVAQKALDQRARELNAEGSMRVGSLRGVRSRRIVLVDDVLTTGATLTEARRAITQAGGQASVAVTVASVRKVQPSDPFGRSADGSKPTSR